MTDIVLPGPALSFQPVFQPIVTARASHQAIRYELLARLRLDDGTLLAPGPLLDQTSSLEVEIDLCALGAATVVLGEQNTSRLSLNAGKQTLLDPQWIDGIDALAAHPSRANRLMLEVTERGRFSASGDDLAQLARLRRAGVTIALDDLSGREEDFEDLLAVRPDVVKLDRSVGLMALEGHVDALDDLVTAADDIGALTVMEGMETEAAALWFGAVGVDLLQGYFFGRPSPDFPIA